MLATSFLLNVNSIYASTEKFKNQKERIVFNKNASIKMMTICRRNTDVCREKKALRLKLRFGSRRHRSISYLPS